ncbi:MAG TPA: hypothetical protein VK356_00495, partial [Thermomicrobiales bacterium]|nr:hypothetical protein [Thermomicrobiales bacterium]
ISAWDDSDCITTNIAILLSMAGGLIRAHLSILINGKQRAEAKTSAENAHGYERLNGRSPCSFRIANRIPILRSCDQAGWCA